MGHPRMYKTGVPCTNYQSPLLSDLLESSGPETSRVHCTDEPSIST